MSIIPSLPTSWKQNLPYNRLDRAESILRRPTPIEDEDSKKVAQVLRYSEVVKHPSKNPAACR